MTEFYTQGRNDALVCVSTQTFSDGRIGVYASAERLSQSGFRRMLKAEFPGAQFVIEYGRQEYKAVEMGRKECST